ncbi:hypothetical protein I3843_02G137400 [Carya illinoinensis]|nr:hypothetical protein I3843_02G137400 [Carya illinoinensis]
MDAGDWRTELQPEARQRIVSKIMDTLKRHLPVSGQEGLQELRKIAIRFEEKIFTAATSQGDYLRKISLKMLTMETKSQNPPVNSLPPNSTGNGNKPPDPGMSGMQSQLHNQGQPLPIPLSANPSQSRQLLSQNIQNSVSSAGVQATPTLPSALTPASSINQTSIPNAVGQNTNVQNISGTSQNSVGNSMGQGIPSNMFANNPRQMQGRQQVVSQQQQQQQQQSQNPQQYMYQQQLQQHFLKQKFQQPSLSGLQQNQQPSIRQATHSMLQQHPPSVLRQQPQQAAVIHPQQAPMQHQSILPPQQPNAANMQQNQLIAQQSVVGDMQQQQRLLGQQNNLQTMQQQQHQQQLMAQKNNFSSMNQQQLGSQSNVSGLQQQLLGAQSVNSSMQTTQHAVHMLQQSKIPVQQPPHQSTSSLLATQVQPSQSQPQPPQQQLMSQIQSQPSQLQQQLGMQQQSNSLQRDMQQRLQASGQPSSTLLQPQNALDQQKQLYQRAVPDTSSTSLDSTSQTGNANGGDCQEVYQKVKSMSPKALSASVSDIGSDVSMIDRIASSAPGNGSRATVGEDLVAMTKCRLQARNFITQDGTNGPLVFTQYTELMNGIIDTEEDVKALRESGILLNCLKSDAEVTNLWNGMSKSIRLTKVPFLDKVIEDVNKHHSGRWSVKVGNAFKLYVVGSWQFLALLAVIFLLLLMILQAF